MGNELNLDEAYAALADAAYAVIERWDSPAWKDLPHTGESINALRRALAGVASASAAAQGHAQQQEAEEIERLRKDAERYRLLKRGQHWSTVNGAGDTLRGEALDQAIDAALATRSL